MKNMSFSTALMLAAVLTIAVAPSRAQSAAPVAKVNGKEIPQSRADFVIKANAAQGQADKDLKAISAYTFTLPKYKQLMTAMVNLGNAAKVDPKVAGALEGSGNLSLDEMTMRLQSLAPARKAIVDAGLTPREFAVAQGAWLQSGMSYGLMKQYNLTADSVSKATGASKANLEFFRANEASFFVTGTDLFLITNYTGLDPIVNGNSAAVGGSGGVGIDFGNVPIPKGVNFGMRLDF